MMFGAFGSLFTTHPKQDGGAKNKKAAAKKKAPIPKDGKKAERGDSKNGSGRAFLAYEKLTLAELQKKAKQRKIAYSGLNKSQLISVLRM